MKWICYRLRLNGFLPMMSLNFGWSTVSFTRADRFENHCASMRQFHRSLRARCFSMSRLRRLGWLWIEIRETARARAHGPNQARRKSGYGESERETRLPFRDRRLSALLSTAMTLHRLGATRTDHVMNSGLGFVRDSTSCSRSVARLSATYSRHRASSLFGNVLASHGIRITLPHSRPFAL